MIMQWCKKCLKSKTDRETGKFIHCGLNYSYNTNKYYGPDNVIICSNFDERDIIDWKRANYERRNNYD